jgi:hypothetical protein
MLKNKNQDQVRMYKPLNNPWETNLTIMEDKFKLFILKSNKEE